MYIQCTMYISLEKCIVPKQNERYPGYQGLFSPCFSVSFSVCKFDGLLMVCDSTRITPGPKSWESHFHAISIDTVNYSHIWKLGKLVDILLSAFIQSKVFIDFNQSEGRGHVATLRFLLARRIQKNRLVWLECFPLK